jgi:branched-subunit amino acid ABC-type transport system permease component
MNALNPIGLNIGLLEVLCILVFIAVVALIVWLVKRSGGGRECPHCAESIKAAAKVCRFCGREV